MGVACFKIGEAFPASDPVARFLTGLAMISNDWLRLITQLPSGDDRDPDAAGLRLMSFRQQASLFHEAAVFMTTAPKRFPAIAEFISRLEPAATDAYEQIVGAIDPASPHFQGPWLAGHRNVTSHYPEMHPEKFTLTEGESASSIRFGFADEIVVQWLPSGEDGDPKPTLERLRTAVLALGRFTREALAAYLASRPAGTISIERDDRELIDVDGQRQGKP